MFYWYRIVAGEQVQATNIDCAITDHEVVIVLSWLYVRSVEFGVNRIFANKQKSQVFPLLSVSHVTKVFHLPAYSCTQFDLQHCPPPSALKF